MPGMNPQTKENPADSSMKRFLTRAEAVTLIGMALTVFSLFLVWRVSGLPGGVASPEAIARFELRENGFNLGLHWILLFGGVLSSVGLLFQPNPKNRLPLACVQGAGGLICFLTALRYFAPLPGVLLGILGGAMLVFGAVDRFSAAQEPGGESAR